MTLKTRLVSLNNPNKHWITFNFNHRLNFCLLKREWIDLKRERKFYSFGFFIFMASFYVHQIKNLHMATVKNRWKIEWHIRTVCWFVDCLSKITDITETEKEGLSIRNKHKKWALSKSLEIKARKNFPSLQCGFNKNASLGKCADKKNKQLHRTEQGLLWSYFNWNWGYALLLMTLKSLHWVFTKTSAIQIASLHDLSAVQ